MKVGKDRKHYSSGKYWHWPKGRVNHGGSQEYLCQHGVGHGGVHGCDGCCSDPSFPKSTKKGD